MIRATHQVSTAECHILAISQANGADLRSIKKHKRNEMLTTRTTTDRNDLESVVNHDAYLPLLTYKRGEKESKEKKKYLASNS